MDRYEISSYAIWYGIYLFLFIAILGGLSYLGIYISSLPSTTIYIIFGVIFGIIFIGLFINVSRRLKIFSIPTIILTVLVENQFFFNIFAACVLIYGILQLTSLESSVTTNYEPFEGSSDLSSATKKVQTITSNLRKALDTFQTATDDTCSVIKGIEAKFLDNATAPSGDQDPPPTKAEAKELRVKAMPRAEIQWKKEKQDWSSTHGQVGVLECFEDGSLGALVEANRELKDLLMSAPVQRVSSQIKQIQTSAQFAQGYIDKLVTQLQSPEGFDNPTPEPTVEDTLASSKQLLANAQSIMTQIQSVLSTVKELKTNYTMINQKSNDPNTVQNLASSSKS